MLIFTVSCIVMDEGEVEVLSCILRDRIIITDQLLMRKSLFVSFQVNDNLKELPGKKIKGIVSCNGKKLSETLTWGTGSRFGNLVFDLDYQIPKGFYEIVIKIITAKGQDWAKSTLTIDSSKLSSYANNKIKNTDFKPPQITQPIEKKSFSPTIVDNNRGYAIFSRSPLRYVFSGAMPVKNEVKDEFNLIMVQNEFEPLTFTIFPLRDLGKVNVSISDLVGFKDIISKNSIKICHIEEVESTLGMPDGKYQPIPNLLKPTNKVRAKKGKCERFWLTAWVGPGIQPGLYKGTIRVETQFDETHHYPFNIKVAPVLLSDIPQKDYFMLMTYEFVELTMPWSKKDKEKIYSSALAILRDYKDHGMTTVCFHSPFVPIIEKDGSPDLEDIYAALKGIKETGFTRPIIYYMGHLIQTAKPQHPGNINGFDNQFQIKRLKDIVKKLKAFSRENECPEVILLPIDEPEDRYSDPSGRRQKMAPILLSTINKAGAKTMVTGSELNDNIDYICSHKLDKKQLLKANQNGKKYWIYDNAVTLTADNPAYARYKYGYYIWREGIDGITSWTFQNTQNAAGFPGVADTSGREVFLAYPDPRGPFSTLQWEAIREGIDDHKLLYQLGKRILILNQKRADTKKYVEFLSTLGQKNAEPDLNFRNDRLGAATFFKSNRERLIALIIKADEVIAKNNYSIEKAGFNSQSYCK